VADRRQLESEIQTLLDGVVSYDLEKMFPKLEGIGAKGKVRSKLKLLKKLLPDLQTALMDGETLLYVARGFVVNWWEALVASAAMAQYMNTTCVVLTDRRILLVNSKTNGKQKHFRNQLFYSEIESVKMKKVLSRTGTLKLKDGSKIHIGGFKGIDCKLMETYIPEQLNSLPTEAPSFAKSLQYLCPKCAEAYVALRQECEGCGTIYKNAKKAAIMSLALPGLGDLYLGHRLFGTMELVGSLFEWLILIGFIRGISAGEAVDMVFFSVWIVFMISTNVIDYFVTLEMGKKGLIAARG
jgi:uncharacterized protein (DUF983 family)